MKILITNDDGVYADGIIALANALSSEHDVTVVAPDRERSACGRAITFHTPLMMKEANVPGYQNCRVYSTTGTPADCVKLGCQELLKEDVELVLSGINVGSNLGTDVAYSGTVNAAFEACVLGYPAVALSQKLADLPETDFGALLAKGASYAAAMIRQIDLSQLDGILYNINFPAVPNGDPAGLKVCGLGLCNYDERFERRVDPFGREYYWPCGRMHPCEYNEQNGTDIYWVNENYITVTPLSWNSTAFDRMETTKCKFGQAKLHF